MKNYFWEIGTHFYEPFDKISRPTFIKKIQHPCKNIWVVGEAVSRNQGWVEGALESVESIQRVGMMKLTMILKNYEYLHVVQ